MSAYEGLTKSVIVETYKHIPPERRNIGLTLAELTVILAGTYPERRTRWLDGKGDVMRPVEVPPPWLWQVRRELLDALRVRGYERGEIAALFETKDGELSENLSQILTNHLNGLCKRAYLRTRFPKSNPNMRKEGFTPDGKRLTACGIGRTATWLPRSGSQFYVATKKTFDYEPAHQVDAHFAEIKKQLDESKDMLLAAPLSIRKRQYDCGDLAAQAITIATKTPVDGQLLTKWSQELIELITRGETFQNWRSDYCLQYINDLFKLDTAVNDRLGALHIGPVKLKNAYGFGDLDTLDDFAGLERLRTSKDAWRAKYNRTLRNMIDPGGKREGNPEAALAFYTYVRQKAEHILRGEPKDREQDRELVKSVRAFIEPYRLAILDLPELRKMEELGTTGGEDMFLGPHEKPIQERIKNLFP